ncbi:HNH endonuclease [Acinetobacter sp. ANC 4973]|uniref:HNH endonuclease n=1 Tax=Acinetobacter sp. ANC 4973 TaxID=1977871 RepID=UPI000A3354ED|nr:HNH endonuclease [Acinetobacter sp. ANC 4973]OTG98941.1 hypothetical protein B9T30_11505 [Acinetobacter sp. ANC 4973]
MEVTKDSIAQKYNFSKCVICTHKFMDEDPNPCSDEHIIPEFLGGKLKVKFLCKICNNNLGGGVESRLAVSFFGKAHAHQYQIKGKSGRVPNSPLVGNYEYNNTTIFFAPDYTIKMHPAIECTVREDGGITFKGSIDANNLESSKQELVTMIIRKFKQQDREVNRDSIYEQISANIDNLPRSVHEKPKINIRVSIDLSDIQLLHLKIAYEILCIHFGEEIIDDSFFDKWRLSLQHQVIDTSIPYGNKSFFETIEHLKDLSPGTINFTSFEEGHSRNNILIILSPNAIFVRCLGFWGVFKINKSESLFLYEHGVLDGKLQQYNYDEFIIRFINIKSIAALDQI